MNATLEDTFDVGGASDDDAESDGDDRQRLMRGNASASASIRANNANVSIVERERVELPQPVTAGNRAGDPAVAHTFALSNDGVFANLNAKPERGEKTEEQPPVRFGS